MNITLRVPGLDHFIHAEQYEALVSDLEAQGVAVGVALEPDIRDDTQRIVVSIEGGGEVRDTVLKVAAATKDRLHGRRVCTSQTVLIYGPYGRLVGTVEIDSDPTRLDERD